VLKIPTGTTLTAPIWFDDDGDPLFSSPKAQLLAHVALRECDPTDVDSNQFPDGSLEIDLGNVVIGEKQLGGELDRGAERMSLWVPTGITTGLLLVS